ncbi:MAG: hypothetical protein BGO41_10400 [Clostridiales bacterium 38-18]|nr:MAG: hypothetical protein BGO41_10400 [Clostridiales bacterium 38-18]
MQKKHKVKDDQLLETAPLKFDSYPWQIIIIYLIFGFSWIIFSDNFLSIMVKNQTTYAIVQTYKGMIFVGLTALLLYFLVKAYYDKSTDLLKTITYKNHDLVTYSEELVAMSDELNEKIFKLNQTMDDLVSQKQYVYEIYNNSNTAILVWNLKGEIMDVNDRFIELLGYGEADLIGNKWFEIILPESEKVIVSEILTGLKENYNVSNFENKVKTKDGLILDMIWNDSLIQNPISGMPMVVSFGIDITTQKENERKVYENAYTDPLTKLGNRTAFEQQVLSLIERNRDFTVYYLDIDNFRNINDYYGHKYGDLFLQELTDRMCKSFSKCGLFRWCGDEFMIIDENTSQEKIKRMSELIVSELTQPWAYEIVDYNPTVSVGIVNYPQDSRSMDEIYKNIDLSLHHSKEKGLSNISVYRPEFQSNFEHRVEVEKLIHDAIQKNAFELNFQPIFHLETRSIRAVEVLIRWKDKSIGISAGEWIAEETEQILKVDQWVIKAAFEFSQMHLKGRNVVTTINISSKTLLSDAFIDFVGKASREFDIDPKTIEFELTEHSLIDDLNRSLKRVKDLKTLGFKIALDDFGTRYSSLNYLSHMPFDSLKIDKSYVDKIVNQSSDLIIVEQIVMLCNRLNIVTIAEGIENSEQLRLLQSIHCDFGQGYLFSKPVDTETIVAML